MILDTPSSVFSAPRWLNEVERAPSARVVWSPELQSPKRVRVWLPPSYGQPGRRYPVVYAQDGQNVFGCSATGGSWRAPQAMEALAATGIEAILVGVDADGLQRASEYSPFVDRMLGGGNGDRYVSFLADTLKPQIDAELATRPEAGSTTLLGSSLGALISLYGFLSRPDAFGSVAALSPSTTFADGGLKRAVEQMSHNAGRIYLDAGTNEFDAHGARCSLTYVRRVRNLYGALCARGFDPLYREVPGGRHDERSWGARLPEALGLLLGADEARTWTA